MMDINKVHTFFFCVSILDYILVIVPMWERKSLFIDIMQIYDKLNLTDCGTVCLLFCML